MLLKWYTMKMQIVICLLHTSRLILSMFELSVNDIRVTVREFGVLDQRWYKKYI